MVKSFCQKVLLGGFVVRVALSASTSDWAAEMAWQQFQQVLFDGAQKGEKGGTTSSSKERSFDPRFLDRLQQGGDDSTFLRLGLLSGLWGGTLQPEEMSALWMGNVSQQKSNVFSYLVGKFVGSQVIQYYKTLEQKPAAMPAHLFDLTQSRFQTLVAFKSTTSSGYAQRSMSSLLSAPETFKALQERLTQGDVRRYARAFEVAYASQQVPSWVQKYAAAKDDQQRKHFEKLLLCLPSKILLLAARQFRLSQQFPEAVVSYALVASKSQKARPECDEFIQRLIAEKKSAPFEQLIPQKRGVKKPGA